VTQVLNKKTETKYFDIAEENANLYHNVGYSPLPPVVSDLKSLQVFFNPWADINQGVQRNQRIGDKITPRGMSIKLWLANKLDRPNVMYRIIVCRTPKTMSGTIVSWLNCPIFDGPALGVTTCKMILPLDKDKGVRAYYDRVINVQTGQSATLTANKESHKLVKLWIKRKGSKNIIYDNTTANTIANNPLSLFVIPYDSFGTLHTDNIASCSYYCRMYYKDI